MNALQSPPPSAYARPAEERESAGPIRGAKFVIRSAHEGGELDEVNALVGRMYAARGYEVKPLPSGERSARKTFSAFQQGAAVGTLTVGLESRGGLLATDIFPGEVAALQAMRRSLCEFNKLAMDRVRDSRRILAGLFHVAYLHARQAGVHVVLIEVNPRHVQFYKSMLGFNAIGEERMNPRVNAPAVLLALEMQHAEAEIGRFGGRTDAAATERSMYPYFFSAADAAGIADRLQRGDEEVARIEAGAGEAGASC